VNGDPEMFERRPEAVIPQSVRGKAGNFYQCDSEVAIQCGAGNRCSQLPCDGSSVSISSGSDDNEDDDCQRVSRGRYQEGKDDNKQGNDRHRRRRTVTRTVHHPAVSHRDRTEYHCISRVTEVIGLSLKSSMDTEVLKRFWFSLKTVLRRPTTSGRMLIKRHIFDGH